MPADLTVVLDTNVWISGIFFRRGTPARILAAWRDTDKAISPAYTASTIIS